MNINTFSCFRIIIDINFYFFNLKIVVCIQNFKNIYDKKCHNELFRLFIVFKTNLFF